MKKTKPLQVEGELTIYRAAELCTQWNAELTALPAGSPLAINLAKVTEIDSAGVQLLMAAQKSAQALQRAMQLIAPSAAVLEVFETLSLHEQFGVSRA